MPLRLLLWRALRAEVYCAGGEEGARGCPEANQVRCGACQHAWEPEDTNAPGKCPACGARLPTVERCANCPVNDIAYVRAHSAAGRLMNRILELDFDAKQFAVPWSEVTAEEAWGLKMLQEEREKRTQELQEKWRQDHPPGMPRR